MSALLLALPASLFAINFKQPGFSQRVVFTGLVNPTVVRFLPDGSVLVAEKSGLIKKFDSLTDPTATVVADLRTNVHNFWDRGMLGFAVPPGFDPVSPDEWRRNVYVLYTHDAVIGGTAPKWGTAGVSGDPCPSPPSGPGPTTDGCVVSGRLSKLLATGANWALNEEVLIEDWCQQFPSHATGALDFGADEKLYVTGGDGASFNNADWGQFGGTVQVTGAPGTYYTPANPCGDPPFAIGTPQTKPTAEGGALRSQSPRRPAGQPRLLNGSLLRVDPETGDALPDNPLFASTDANEQRIIGYGLRNPFRMIVRPGTNEVFVADVGWGTWEEINRLPDLTTARNFGWPCFEGNATQYTGLSICPTQVQTTAPLFTYNHSASAVAGDGCPTGGSSVAGMAFYEGGSNYPAAYGDALFFSDYSRKCMWVMFEGGSGVPDPATRAAFASNVAGPVDLQIGPDGNLYYVDFDSGTIVRVVYGLNAVAAATSPTAGSLPLSVSFTGTGSTVATPGDTLTYAWDLDGDGQFDDSTASQPTFNYSVAGDVNVRLRVTDNHGGFAISTPVVVHAGNNPPTATITAPAPTLTWKVGDSIAFSGSATDPETGALPPSSLEWEILIQHCPTTCHTHVYETFSGVSGGTFNAPDHEYPSHLEIRLTATDPVGLTHAASVEIQPQTVLLSFQSNPTGLELNTGNFSGTTPFIQTLIVGSLISIEAPDQGPYEFVSWSDGGAQSHQITAPAVPGTYTATFFSGGALPPPWVQQDVGDVALAGSATFSAGAFLVNGSGADIEEGADEFHYVYQPISGDGAIIARVATQDDTDPWAKAGVMIRKSVAADSAHAVLAVTPDQGLAFQRRLADGSSTTAYTGGALVEAPYWVKVVRTGSTFTSFSSPDGVAWTLVGSDTIAMPESTLFGLAVTSHNDGVVGSGLFDNVTVDLPPDPTISTPAPSLLWKVGDTIAFSGSAVDALEGPTPASSLSWTVLMHYCPSTCTTQVIGTFDGVAGEDFVVPAALYPSTIEIQLAAVDSTGLSKTTSITLNPQTVGLTFQTAPTGLNLTVDGVTAAAPIARTVIVNAAVPVNAPSPQGTFPTVWTFSSWSDAGAQSHTITAPAVATAYTATFVGNADLSIGMSASPDPVAAGSNVTYTLTVSNAGPAQANSVSVSDTLPAGATLVSATGSGWSCSGTGPVVCTRPTLGIGSAPALVIVVTAPDEPAPFVNTASVSGSTTDPASGNNSAQSTSTVFASADLSLSQSGAPPSVCAGEAAAYTLLVSNAGPSAATSVSVTSTLPAGATLVSATGTGWACSGSTTVTCTRPTLASGASASIAIAVTAPSTAGPATNTASVSSSVSDPSSLNNTGGASITVKPIPAPPAAGSTAVCAGETLQLTASTVAGAIYAWTGPNAFTSTVQNPSIPNATPANSGVYNVTVTVDGCTSAAATTSALVRPLPTATVSGTVSICDGATAQISATLTGTGPWTLIWSDGLVHHSSTTPALRDASPSSTTVYTVTSVTDAHCTNAGTGSTEVVVGALDAPTITAPLSAGVGATGLAASVAPHAGATYAWSLTGGTITSGQGTAAITFSAGAPGTTMALSVVETSGACVSPAATHRVQVDFLDVPPSHGFHDYVNTIARNGVTAGCGNGNYCPDATNTRAQMAVFLLKSKFGADHVPPAAVGVFDDVPASDPFAPWIEEAAALQITAGCGGNNYCPTSPVTRAQMAVFLLKTLLGSSYVPPTATGTVFGDVPQLWFAAAWIEDLYARGITGGCQASPLLYCPDGSVTRGQMSVFLVRTFELE